MPGHAAGWLRRLIDTTRAHPVMSLAILFALILAAVVAWWVRGSGAAAGYVTAPLARGNVTQAITATGSVNPVLTITVGSYVSGVIQEIDCDFNTRVKKGQLCAKIDARPYQTIVEQNRASVATARAQLLKDRADLAYAQINERRYASLSAQNATSRDSYDAAVNALNQARAQVAVDQATIEQRQAALDAAIVNLGYTNIVAPVDGIVVSRNVTMGQTVASSFQTPTLFLIATDLSKMQVDTSVSESDVGAVDVGNKARFTVEAYPDRTFEGIVGQVRQAPQTVQNVITYDVVITAANPQMLLRPGMTATVRIITAQRRNVLRVSDTALRYVPGGLSPAGSREKPTPGVWVLREGRPVRVTIAPGLDDGTYTEILKSDLREGDRVIVSESTDTARTSRRSTNGGPALRLP
ncbi:MAG TPA: efflux RND transporter periplasmic adaptor subunit [Rhizomicrobium sp.]|nr:efflux RND transporter periplasmic adaptor subunit [Rhizomicrobium sp.]